MRTLLVTSIAAIVALLDRRLWLELRSVFEASGAYPNKVTGSTVSGLFHFTNTIVLFSILIVTDLNSLKKSRPKTPSIFCSYTDRARDKSMMATRRLAHFQDPTWRSTS